MRKRYSAMLVGGGLLTLTGAAAADPGNVNFRVYFGTHAPVYVAPHAPVIDNSHDVHAARPMYVEAPAHHRSYREHAAPPVYVEARSHHRSFEPERYSVHDWRSNERGGWYREDRN